jgi:hypothetical protein
MTFIQTPVLLKSGNQRCTLSQLLLIITLEGLANAIRQEERLMNPHKNQLHSDNITNKQLEIFP